MGEVMSEKLEKNLEQTASKKMRLLKLFWSTLYLSAFTFGGGYVIVSLMKKKFVDEMDGLTRKRCSILLQLLSPHLARLL